MTHRKTIKNNIKQLERKRRRAKNTRGGQRRVLKAKIQVLKKVERQVQAETPVQRARRRQHERQRRREREERDRKRRGVTLTPVFGREDASNMDAAKWLAENRNNTARFPAQQATPALTFTPNESGAKPGCSMKLAWCIIDAIFLAAALPELRGGATEHTARAVQWAVDDVLATEIEQIVRKMEFALSTANQGLSTSGARTITLEGAWDIASGCASIMGAIWGAGQGSSLIAAIYHTLTWYDAALFAISGMASVVAMLATDGIAWAAIVVGDTAALIMFAEDIYAYVQCENA